MWKFRYVLFAHCFSRNLTLLDLIRKVEFLTVTWPTSNKSSPVGAVCVVGTPESYEPKFYKVTLGCSVEEGSEDDRRYDIGLHEAMRGEFKHVFTLNKVQFELTWDQRLRKRTHTNMSVFHGVFSTEISDLVYAVLVAVLQRLAAKANRCGIIWHIDDFKEVDGRDISIFLDRREPYRHLEKRVVGWRSLWSDDEREFTVKGTKHRVLFRGEASDIWTSFKSWLPKVDVASRPALKVAVASGSASKGRVVPVRDVNAAAAGGGAGGGAAAAGGGARGGVAAAGGGAGGGAGAIVTASGAEVQRHHTLSGTTTGAAAEGVVDRKGLNAFQFFNTTESSIIALKTTEAAGWKLQVKKILLDKKHSGKTLRANELIPSTVWKPRPNVREVELFFKEQSVGHLRIRDLKECDFMENMEAVDIPKDFGVEVYQYSVAWEEGKRDVHEYAIKLLKEFIHQIQRRYSTCIRCLNRRY